MLEFLAWLEATALGDFIRETGRWTYGLTNLVHVLGIALLFGAITILDLRLVGVWRKIPMSAIAVPTVTVAATGLTVALISGVFLLSAQATEYLGNPFLYFKFGAIALGAFNLALLHYSPSWKALKRGELPDKLHGRLALAGGVSLLSWLVAIASGRMIAYW
ncbi:MAG: hypothetical protein IID54_00030 [Proteobacteria bacterium]|nr:hypothetical protein [Pseudomonadota bacterium]